LYGLKQAPRAWFHRLTDHLLEGFTTAKSDTSLFVRYVGTSITILLVYVDDIIVTGNNDSVTSTLIKSLNASFSLKDWGTLHHFLGIDVQSTSDGLFVSQQRYIQDLLLHAKMDCAKPYSTPAAAGSQLSEFAGTPINDVTLYRSTVGALKYLTISRPEIAFSVNKVC